MAPPGGGGEVEHRLAQPDLRDVLLSEVGELGHVGPNLSKIAARATLV